MPGPSRSKGCFRCRAKKIKCDENHPECQRCQRLGVPCPGYRAGNEVIFYDMTDRIENKIHGIPRRRKSKKGSQSLTTEAKRLKTNTSKVSTPNSSPDLDIPSNAESLEISWLNDQGTPLCNPMHTDFKTSALCQFLGEYTQDTWDLKADPGFFHGLTKVYSDASDSSSVISNSVLTHAVEAVSLASFSQQVNSEDLLYEARQYYGKSLGLVQKALSNGTEATKDATMGGVICLNMCEMFTGDQPSTVWDTHADALGMLLRMRGSQAQFTSPYSGGISRAAHRVVLFRDLMQHRAPGPESALLDSAIDPAANWAHIEIACNRISRILPLADSTLYQCKTSPNEQNVESLMKVIGLQEAADWEFMEWNRISSYFPRKNAWWVEGYRNMYRATRILLLQAMRKLTMHVIMEPMFTKYKQRVERLYEEAGGELSDMVRDISWSIGCILNEVDEKGWAQRRPGDGKAIAVYTSVWPLKVALSVEDSIVGPQMRDWMKGQLGLITDTVGIRQPKKMNE